jgi:DnaJ-class molecular chaperone
VAKRDYYEVLGAKKGASAEELKKAFLSYDIYMVV